MKNTLLKVLTGISLSCALLSATSFAAPQDAIATAVADASRSSDARLRDEYRHPQQTLRFFDVQPGTTVVEITPGGGWYSDILAALLKDNGKLVAAHFHVDENTRGYYVKSREKFAARVANDPAYSAVEMATFHPVHATEIAAAESADTVLTFRNVHNWYMGGEQAMQDAFAAFYRVLKKGGTLGVVEHRLPESAPDAMMKSSGYMKQSVVVKAAEQAGFKLVASSEINANPMDSAAHPKGVWTLPPSLRLGDEDKAKYLAIGESDRMTLKFTKP